jgi:hypothetical protein
MLVREGGYQAVRAILISAAKELRATSYAEVLAARASLHSAKKSRRSARRWTHHTVEVAAGRAELAVR